ncbi:MAG: OmpA family protein [Altibacter sp.]|uniref:OmpA family protein n=1 Tax=Altibacter sp. TaxID=2024823 RepID=UPI001D779AC4|nr:OmpA family protein [Altibacter sp.]MBZ0328240.1 OmpA family protein [Altibacter sp.]
MKKQHTIVTIVLSVLFVFAGTQDVESQILKKLKKKAENTATRKLEQKTQKDTEKVMDTLLGNGGNNGGTSSGGSTSGNSGSSNEAETNSNSTSNSNSDIVDMYSKSDWVAGEDLILFDDFADDPEGDFPQLWNTNSSGEIVTLSSHPGVKWLKLYNRGMYQPDLPKNLPKDFTIEFDAIGFNIHEDNTSQTANLYVILGDGRKALKEGAYYASASLSPYQKWVKEQFFKSWDSKQGEIVRGNRDKDIRQAFQEGAHIAISVKGNRYRLYVNGDKIFDFPRAIKDGALLNSVLFNCYGVGDEKQNVLITNLRIAEGLPEPRAKLFSTGKYTTNAILFDVNSAEIKAESYGILREIAEAMKTEPDKNILIVGHTDSDGTDSHNLELSNNRAASVKNALVSQFGVSADRLTTKGKGESEPVASNDSAMNKAKNRRTEFIVQ